MSTTLIRKVAQFLGASSLGNGADEFGRREPSGPPATGAMAPLGGHAGADASRNPYVNSQVLEHFQHAFDAEELWRSARSQAGLRGGLRALIDAHPHLGDRRLPTSIVLELPEELIEHDVRIGGNSTQTLLAGLAELYMKDNKERLRGGESPRFMAVAAADLPPHQIRVRMGAAIHVPGDDETPVWKLQYSLDGTIWPDDAVDLIPSGQRLLIVGGSPHHASSVCRNWPFPPEYGVAMVSRPDSPELLLSSQPLKALRIQYNPQLRCHVVQLARGRTDAVSRMLPAGEPGSAELTDAAQAEPVLYLRAERLVPVALHELPSRDDAGEAAGAQKPPPSVAAAGASAAMAGAGAALPGPTRPVTTSSTRNGAPAQAQPQPQPQANKVGPDAAVGVSDVALGTDAGPPHALDSLATLLAAPPLRQPAVTDGLLDATTLLAQPVTRLAGTLSLEGLALQRPSNFAAHGVKGLQFGVSAQGSVVAPDSPLRALRFDVSAADELFVSTGAGTRTLALGQALPLAQGQQVLQLLGLPPELASHYLGWLRLPLGQPMPLVEGRSVAVGRQMEALKPLQPLAGPGFLTEVPALPGDQMGLSRQHFALQALGGDANTPPVLEVCPVGANTVAHLDQDMCFVARVTAQQPARLQPGDCLVVGHYVWRFNAPARGDGR